MPMVSTIPAADRWGPFADDIDAVERLARLWCLRAIVHLLCGPQAPQTCQASIRDAERERTMGSLATVLAELDTLAAKDRRHLLASYAAISRT